MNDLGIDLSSILHHFGIDVHQSVLNFVMDFDVDFARLSKETACQSPGGSNIFRGGKAERVMRVAQSCGEQVCRCGPESS